MCVLMCVFAFNFYFGYVSINFIFIGDFLYFILPMLRLGIHVRLILITYLGNMYSLEETSAQSIPYSLSDFVLNIIFSAKYEAIIRSQSDNIMVINY